MLTIGDLIAGRNSDSFSIMVLTDKIALAGVGCVLAATAFLYGRSRGYHEAAMDDQFIADGFHVLYHNKHWDNVRDNTRWLGTTAMKSPLDLWIYQEILYETRPDVIIETGTHKAGSSLYYATMFDLLGSESGRILTMDVEDLPKAVHRRIHFRLDSSTSEGTLAWLKSNIRPTDRVMVSLDSLHDKEYVLKELDMYSQFVTAGNYLVVEDTHLNGHPIRVPFTPTPGHDGPWEALQEWLPKHPEFAQDRAREKFVLTFNPGGWLRRLQ